MFHRILQHTKPGRLYRLLFNDCQKNIRPLSSSRLWRTRAMRKSVISCKYRYEQSELSLIEPRNTFLLLLQSHNFLIFFTMSKLSKLLLDTIQSRKITPRSKWYFTTMHTVLWSVFCVAVLIGTLAISLLFLEMTIPERHYMQWVSLPGTMRILPYLPLLW